MVNRYVGKRSRLQISGVLMLLAGVLCVGCRPEAEEPDARRARLPLADPQAATYLVDAQQALRAGQVGQALALADSAERRAGSGSEAFLADIHFLRGRIQTALNHFAEAEASYDRVLALEPAYQGVWLNLGNNAFRQGQYSQALAYYRRAYEAHPDPTILVYSGRAYDELGVTDSARYAYEQAVAQADSLAEAYARLAVLYSENGEPEKALAHAQRAVDLEPDNPHYRYVVGTALLQNGQVAEAAAQLRQVLARQPGHAEAHYSLGQALVRLGKQEEARRYMAAWDSLQALEESIRRFEVRTRIYPDDPAAWATYGFALSRAGRNAEAIRALQVALHQGPSTPDVHVLLANAYLKHQQPERALVHYDAALQHDSSFVGAWVNKGICLARLGQPEAAREAWETALRLDPDQPAVRDYLAGLDER